MDCQALYFISPGKVEVRPEPEPSPGAGMVLVKTLYSAISPGTEMLFYLGQIPGNLLVDKNLRGMDKTFTYPLKYGYALVGEVISLGRQVDLAWEGKRVFAFHPHESHFCSPIEELIPIPDDISIENAVFLPNMETAVNFIMDGTPIIGEKAVVFGPGIVGLMTTSLLVQFPLAKVVTFDIYPRRREAAENLGVTACLDPFNPDCLELTRELLMLKGDEDGADLTYELSGVPDVLNQAITLTGFNGRVVIGSWYGSKQAQIDLGGRFHRSRIQLISSQVSTLSPGFGGRWTKARRFETAWEMIRRVKPSQWITQRIPLAESEAAYRMLVERPQDAIQVILTY
jgi:2-desacetyl-2-hydroxyethyl bacteriochlorophyllide A dehydrogenase